MFRVNVGKHSLHGASGNGCFLIEKRSTIHCSYSCPFFFGGLLYHRRDYRHLLLLYSCLALPFNVAGKSIMVSYNHFFLKRCFLAGKPSNSKRVVLPSMIFTWIDSPWNSTTATVFGPRIARRVQKRQAGDTGEYIVPVPCHNTSGDFLRMFHHGVQGDHPTYFSQQNGDCFRCRRRRSIRNVDCIV